MGGMQTDSDDQSRLQDRHEPDQERPAGSELILGWGPVRQRRRSGRMGRAYVPEDCLVLETQLVEDPMDDRRGVLDVAAPVEAGPALRWEGPLGGEGHSGEPTAPIPGCLPDQHQRGARPSSKMVRQVRQPDRRRTWPVEGWIGVAVGIERRPDLSSGEIVQQAIERVHFQIIARPCAEQTQRPRRLAPRRQPHDYLWVDEVTVNQTTGHVVDGHLRIELALARNEPTVLMTYVEREFGAMRR